MREKFLIFDLASQSYFLGANPKPSFGSIDEGIRIFDTWQAAETRILEEYELFPELMNQRILEIKPVYTTI